MTPEQHDQIMQQLRATTGLLVMLQKQLERMAQARAPLSPNYRRRLSEFPGFDWQSINAMIVARDRHGEVSEVEWYGHRFDRSTGEKFGGEFVIFSRPAPDWSQTNKVYYTLIRFADYNNTALVIEEPPTPEPPAPPTQSQPARPQLVKPAEPKPAPKAGKRQAVSNGKAPAPTPAAQPPTPAPALDMPMCDWCGERPALPGEPCDQCRALGAEAEAEQPTGEWWNEEPAPAAPAHPLLKQAQAVTDAPGFYALATELLKHNKAAHSRVTAIVHSPETSWTEKALQLIAA